MEEAFRGLLTSSAAILTHVPAGRINWGHHPQGAGKPYIVLIVVSDVAGITMRGPDRLSQGRVQVDCYAPSYEAAKAISRALVTLLDGYRGGQFSLIRHAGSRDHGREGGTNEAERLHRVGLDFMTHWRQT
jgi:hypothetical protein